MTNAAAKPPPLYKPPKNPTKRGPRRRLDAVAREGHIITYECRTCNRRHRFAFVDPLGRPMEFSAKRMERWHSKDGGGTSGSCPFCTRKYRKENRR